MYNFKYYVLIVLNCGVYNKIFIFIVRVNFESFVVEYICNNK